MDPMFISADALECDERLFLQPNPDEKVTVFHKEFTMSDMAVAAGFFPSKNLARKNGWSGPVPLGYGTKKCGKKRVYWFNSMDQRLD